MSLGLLYLFIVILPNATETLGVIAGIAIMCLAVALIIGGITKFYSYSDSGQETAIYLLKIGRKMTLFALALGLLMIPLPRQDQLYLLAGGYVATNTKEIAKLPDNLVSAANAWLKKAAEVANAKKTIQQ